MRAFRLVEPGRTALDEVERPIPGSGEVLLRVGAASFCHSDVAHLEQANPFFDLPVTIGHEFAGTIVEVGPGVSTWEPGTEVAVHIIQGCAKCTACLRGQDNRCHVGFRTPGVHYDGGMAEYVVAPARSLVPLGGVDMVTASVLTDAGITAAHAVAHTRDLLGPTRSALVIGVGGLGHLGLQLAAATTGATVYAVDVEAGRLEVAGQLGAAGAFLAADAAVAIREATGGVGVDVVLDFVGSAESVALAVAVVAIGGALVLVGLGGGEVGMSLGFDRPSFLGPQVPREVRVVRSFCGTRDDLVACLSLARRGVLRVHTETYSLDHAQDAFDALIAGRVLGRAVIVP
jgi:propanol-preferring alcohol dehydrogenase